MKKIYPSDLNKRQWKYLKKRLAKRKNEHCLKWSWRIIVNAIFYSRLHRPLPSQTNSLACLIRRRSSCCPVSPRARNNHACNNPDNSWFCCHTQIHTDSTLENVLVQGIVCHRRVWFQPVAEHRYSLDVIASTVDFAQDSGSGDDSSIVRAGSGDLVEGVAVGVGKLDWVFFASDCPCFHALVLTRDLHCGPTPGC